jgi:hypothetical protein
MRPAYNLEYTKPRIDANAEIEKQAIYYLIKKEGGWLDQATAMSFLVFMMLAFLR